jgi:phage terminase large subunit GpA-like protein
MLTAGVDVQGDRLAIVLRAYGLNEESWQVYWGEIDGNPVDKNDACWDGLDKLLFKRHEHERFGEITLAAVSIDSSDGTTSNAVYHWVRTRSVKYKRVAIMAIKGDSNDQGTKEIFTLPRQVDRKRHDRPSKADRHGVRVYLVGTHKAKDLISKRLTGTSAHMHSSKHVRADYWEQVTAEIKAPSKKHRGKLLWQNRPGKRNEALDCEVYALHAAHAMGMHKMTPAKWTAIETRLGQRTLFTQEAAPEPAPSPTTRKPAPARKRGSWATDLS